MPSNRKSTQTLGSSRVVKLFGEIGEETTKAAIDALVYFDKKGNKDILLLLDSVGGNLDNTVTILQTIRLLRCEVSTLALSTAYSAASILLACGAPGKRMVFDDSMVMVHDITTRVKGFHTVIEQELTNIRNSKQIVTDLMVKAGCGHILKLYKPEPTYLIGKEVISQKIADKVIKNMEDILKVTNI